LRKREPAERVTRRVRAFRKKRREELKKQNTYTWGLRDYFRKKGLTENDWAPARNVYKFIEVLSLRISFEAFMTGIRGDKKEGIPGVKSIEILTLVNPDVLTEKTFFLRPVRIPKSRRKA
jgi:hypothetical protein